MKALRNGLGIASVALLVLGYAASQRAVFTGQAADYAAKVDQPPIRMLALVFLLAAIVFAFLPEREEA